MEQTLSFYKIFNTVAKTGNISHAAKELFISQPAISKSISQLEKSLNVPLFIRSSRGVTLTPEGKLLYEHTKTAFDMILQGEEQLKKRQELGIGEIHVGVTTTLCKYLLLPIIKDFLEQYPHIKIFINCQPPSETISLLESGKLDLGLIVMPYGNYNLQFYPYLDIEDIFVCTNQYLDNLKTQFASHGQELNIFRDANFMLLDKTNVTRQHLDYYLNTYASEAQTVLEVTDMNLLIEFAKIGLGISGVIKEFVKEELNQGELIELPIPFTIPKRTVVFAHHKSFVPSKSLQIFLHFLEKNSDHFSLSSEE